MPPRGTKRKVIDLTDRYPTTALALELDVTEKDHILAGVQDAIDAFGRIDVLVNNAGYGLIGAAEEASDEEIEKIVATNVFGTVDVTRAVLPHMRAQKSGHIVNLSSAAGVVGTAGVSVYNLTKFAVEGFSEGLALEVKPLGHSSDADRAGAVSDGVSRPFRRVCARADWRLRRDGG